MNNAQKLAHELAKLSEANDWEDVKLEWDCRSTYEGDFPGYCLCGKTPIYNHCVLKNIHNHNNAIVGNCCVKKFIGIRTDKIFDSINRITNDPSLSVAKDFIGTAFKKQWIDVEDYIFYRDVFGKQLTASQKIRKIRVNNKILKGYQAIAKINEMRQKSLARSD